MGFGPEWDGLSVSSNRYYAMLAYYLWEELEEVDNGRKWNWYLVMHLHSRALWVDWDGLQCVSLGDQVGMGICCNALLRLWIRLLLLLMGWSIGGARLLIMCYNSGKTLHVSFSSPFLFKAFFSLLFWLHHR